MGFGSIISKFIDFGGLWKSLIAALYRSAYSEEIQAAENERRKLLAELATVQAQVAGQVASDQKQIDELDQLKKPIVEAIKVEEGIQAKDEAEIQKVRDDEKQTAKAIAERPDSTLLRDDF